GRSIGIGDRRWNRVQRPGGPLRQQGARDPVPCGRSVCGPDRGRTPPVGDRAVSLAAPPGDGQLRRGDVGGGGAGSPTWSATSWAGRSQWQRSPSPVNSRQFSSEDNLPTCRGSAGSGAGPGNTRSPARVPPSHGLPTEPVL